MTALDQNFSDLANIIMQRRQMQAQQVQQDRANRLSDLQFKQLQREEDYQTGLRNAMTNPGGSGVTLPQLQPPQPQQNTLASLAPGNQLPFPQPQASFAPVEAKMSPSRAGAEYALGQGKIEDAVKLFSVDDHVAQLRAKGDLQGYYEAQRELEEGSKFFDVVNKFKANPQQLTALWPQIQRMFPQQSEGITPDSIKFDADYTVLPLVMDGQTIPGKGILRDSAGKTSIIDTTPKEQGKPDKREYDEGDTHITELYDASGKLTGTKRAPRYKPAAAGGGTPVAQTTFVDPATGNPLTFDKSTGTYRVATVVGGGVAPKPSAMSPEAAGKAQMIEQGITYMPTLRQELFDKDGSVNRTNVANLVTGTPGTRGRELRTLLLDAVEAKLRAESGAAVPEPEVKRAAKRFIPNPMDSANNVKIKLDNLEAYLKGTAAKINTGRGGNKPSGGNGKPIVTKGGFKVTRVP